jgi:DNA repair exonuclease SbcCD ATPase subunit
MDQRDTHHAGQKEGGGDVSGARLENETPKNLPLIALQELITNIDTKIERMRSLLNTLKQVHERAKTAVDEAKTEKQELIRAIAEINRVLTNEQFRPIFKEGGIKSLQELLQSKKYSIAEEVQRFKQSKQSYAEKRRAALKELRKRRQAKMEARATIGDIEENLSIPEKITYQDIVAVLEKLIGDLENRRKTLYYQTPEGKAEILNRINQRRKESRLYRRALKDAINWEQTVTQDDIRDGREYGNDNVKTAIKIYYSQVIDDELNEEARRDGLLQLQEAIKTIEGLRKRWDEIRATLLEVQSARQATINRLITLLREDLREDKSGLLFGEIQRYGRWGYDDPEKLAEVFIDFQASLNSITLGLEYGKTPEVILRGIISDQENLLQQVLSSGNLTAAFPTSISKGFDIERYSYETKLYNPEIAITILSVQLKFYKKFQAALTTPEEVLDKIRGTSERLRQEIEIDADLSGELGKLGMHNSYEMQSQLWIKFDGRTYATLRGTPLPQIKTRLEKWQNEMNQTAKTLKRQISDKVEVDWIYAELSEFEHNHQQTIKEAEDIIRIQQKFEGLLRNLNSAISALEEQMNQQICFDQRGRLSFCSIPKKDLQQLQNEISKLQQEIQKIEIDICEINRKLAERWSDLLGKRKREKTRLNTQKQALQARLQELQAEYASKVKIDIKLEALRIWLSNAYTEGLKLTIPPKPVLLQELVSSIKEQINPQNPNLTLNLLQNNLEFTMNIKH